MSRLQQYLEGISNTIEVPWQFPYSVGNAKKYLEKKGAQDLKLIKKETLVMDGVSDIFYVFSFKYRALPQDTYYAAYCREFGIFDIVIKKEPKASEYKD